MTEVFTSVDEVFEYTGIPLPPLLAHGIVDAHGVTVGQVRVIENVQIVPAQTSNVLHAGQAVERVVALDDQIAAHVHFGEVVVELNYKIATDRHQGRKRRQIRQPLNAVEVKIAVDTTEGMEGAHVLIGNR